MNHSHILHSPDNGTSDDGSLELRIIDLTEALRLLGVPNGRVDIHGIGRVDNHAELQEKLAFDQSSRTREAIDMLLAARGHNARLQPSSNGKGRHPIQGGQRDTTPRLTWPQ